MSTTAASPAGELLPSGLTAAQREAILAADPVLCVLAGAGTGKTRVLTLRVARRVADATAPAHRVLVTTFSRKAADELRQRLWGLGVDGVAAGTFHRTALRLIRQHRADRGSAPPVVLGDRRQLLGRVLEEAGYDDAPPRDAPRSRRRFGPVQLDNEIGWAKARLVPPGDYEEEATRQRRRTGLAPGAIAELYLGYDELRRRQGLLDLDDLLWSSADVLESDPSFADAVRWRFRHLYVDEMQDVNPAQFRLLRLLFGDDPDLFVVGDPNQSVYGWNGADPGLLAGLGDLFPQHRVLRLDENHRCSPQVVAVASAALGLDPVVGPTSARFDGPVPTVAEHDTEADEARWVARRAWLAHRPGRHWNQIAVLARTNAQLTVVAEALRAAGLPHRLAGTDFGPASDVRAGGDDASPGAERHVEPDPDLSEDAIVLTTFHRAKGLQWPAVFVVGVADGLVPIASARTDAARDEERRLLYVALTRAETELTCSWAATSRPAGGGRTATRRPSPWLAEVQRVCRGLELAAQPGEAASVKTRVAALRLRLAGDGDRPEG